MEDDAEYVPTPFLTVFLLFYSPKVVTQQWKNMVIPAPPENPEPYDAKTYNGACVVWEIFCGRMGCLLKVGREPS